MENNRRKNGNGYNDRKDGNMSRRSGRPPNPRRVYAESTVSDNNYGKYNRRGQDDSRAIDFENEDSGLPS